MVSAAPAPQLGDMVGNGNGKAGSSLRGALQLDVAAMGAHQFGGDGKAQPRAPLPCSTLKGFKQLVANLIRNAGAIVADLDYGHAAFAPGLQGNGAIGRVRPFGLERIRWPGWRCA